MKTKRKDECFACSGRKCYERVVSVDGGWTYDEVACSDHVKDVHAHSDNTAPGVMKHFITSTAKQKRGERFTPSRGTEERDESQNNAQRA